MKKSLIAIATVGVLAAGSAAADTFAVRVDARDGRPTLTVLQDNARHDYRRWHDDGRGMSVDQRQARINARIEHGLRTGALTRREARQVGRQLALTEQKERAFESDGRLTRRELTELNRDLDVVAQRLRFEQRDGERRN